jgi:hypothetical protein
MGQFLMGDAMLQTGSPYGADLGAVIGAMKRVRNKMRLIG